MFDWTMKSGFCYLHCVHVFKSPACRRLWGEPLIKNVENQIKKDKKVAFHLHTRKKILQKMFNFLLLVMNNADKVPFLEGWV